MNMRIKTAEENLANEQDILVKAEKVCKSAQVEIFAWLTGFTFLVLMGFIGLIIIAMANETRIVFLFSSFPTTVATILVSAGIVWALAKGWVQILKRTDKVHEIASDSTTEIISAEYRVKDAKRELEKVKAYFNS